MKKLFALISSTLRGQRKVAGTNISRLRIFRKYSSTTIAPRPASQIHAIGF